LRVTWFSFILVAGTLLYALGVFVRGQYGIRVSVSNMSGQSLHEVKLNLEPRGETRDLGNLGNGQGARVFVRPRTESHVSLTFRSANETHVETVVGYVESGYCGNAEVKVLPHEKVTSTESIDPVFCKKSWLAFAK
jgi:hypothetical protein